MSLNLFHNNEQDDIFPEVYHGPILVDNNVSLSGRSYTANSQGVSFVHNLIAGTQFTIGKKSALHLS